NGSLTLNSDGTFTYVHDGGETTSDSFTYQANDGSSTSNTVTVSISITADNDAPVAVADSYSVTEGGTLNGTSVLSNDTDAESDSLTAVQVSSPANGSLTLNSDGTFTYVHDGGETTSDSFTYQANDGSSNSNTVTVSISITADNDAPVAKDDSVAVDEDSTDNVIPVLDNDIDPEGDELTITQATASEGSVSINSDGTLSYTPEENATDSVTIRYTISDANGLTDTASVTVSINPQNDAPQADAQTITLDEDTNTGITLTATDIDGDSLSYELVSQPENGTLTGNAPELVYTPAPDFFGQDEFTFRANDGTEDSELAVISITVEDVLDNKAPLAVNDAFEVLKNSTANRLDVLLNDSDPDGDKITVVQVYANLGEVSVTTDGAVVYSPMTDSTQNDLLTYVIEDEFGESASAEVHITVVTEDNLPPIAVDDSVTMQTGETITLDVLANDYDPEDDAIELVAVSGDVGEVVIVDGALQFTPQSNIHGDYLITYSIRDAAGNFASAEVLVNVESESGPFITLPEDLCSELTVMANALYTKVDLGQASAVDRFGNVLPVSLLDGNTLYPPGINQAFWSATDAEGNTAIATQLVCVAPLVSIQKDQTVLKGSSTTIGVYLNGESPVYPLVVPYTLSGDATEEDHNLEAGDLIIESGTTAYIALDTFINESNRSDRVVTVSLDESLNRGAKDEHNVLLTERNIEPDVTLQVLQNHIKRLTVSRRGGAISVISMVEDPNLTDSHQYAWITSDHRLVNEATNDTAFIFDPSLLEAGIYHVSIEVTDSGAPQLSDSETIYIEVVEELLSFDDHSLDSDGDLIPDHMEGYQDTDGDGIPDFLDRIDECNVLQEVAKVHDAFLIEGQAGVCLRRGDHSIGGETGGAQITNDDIAQDELDELVDDPDAINVGGIFDYIAYGMPEQGTQFAIVMPQRKPIPADAVYRKFRPGSGWGFFIEDANNSLWSTPGDVGFCPPPDVNSGNSVWTPGLTEGHWCVQQIIEDGGVNDDDNLVNGTIVDPGGVGVMITSNALPEASDDSVTLVVNQEITVDVIANDTDQNGDPLLLTSATTTIGEVSIVDNAIHYVAALDYVGEITINYGVTDSNGGTDHAVLTINLIDNKAPLITNDSSEILQGETATLNLLTNDSDPDGDQMRLLSVEHSGVSFSENGEVVFTPQSDFYGVLVIDYQVSDEWGNQSFGQWSVTVTEYHRIEASTRGGGSLYGLLLLGVFVSVIRKVNWKANRGGI
ncbi:tandem-95 repeat protein, partial [Alteromonas aestuariivivens]